MSPPRLQRSPWGAPGEAFAALAATWDPRRGEGALLALGAAPPGALVEVAPPVRDRLPAIGHALHDALPRIDRGALRPPALRAGLLAAERPPAAITGRSLDLPLALALASAWVDLPLPTTLAATGALDGGRLAPVGCVAEKAALIADEAPAVRRLLVHPDQVGEVERGSGGRLRGEPVTHLADALGFAWPDLVARVEQRWQADPDRVDPLVDDLLRAAVLGRPALVCWRAVARTAESLLPSSPSRAGSLRWITQIARRHEGDAPDALVDPPEDAPRSLRLRYLAHAVQSASERDPERAERLARAAAAALPARPDRSASALELAGAIGRALAAAGRVDEAAVWLDEVVDDWFAQLRPEEASRPLCALLEITSDRGALAVRAARARRVAEVAAPPSPAFLAVAEAAAWRRCGDPDQARVRLAEVPSWEAAPAHLRDARDALRRDLG